MSMIRDFVEILRFRLQGPAHFIQILLGPRQVGKTTGVRELATFFPNFDFIYVSADDIFSGQQEWLRQQWQNARLRKNEKILVIDEIQTVPGWAQLVKSLWDEDKRNKQTFHVIGLGSSSLDLHQGLSESLAGRFELHQITHWSWEESRKLARNLDFRDYLRIGGYPELLKMDELQRQHNYLKNSIVEPVISKDILQNVTVKKPALFRQCFELACSYGGQVLSYNKMLGQLQEGGNVDLVKYYLRLMEYAFLIKTVGKFHGKEIKKRTSSPKLLPLALGFMNLFGVEEEGRIFEVAVGQELVKNFTHVYYWEGKNKEVDFVIKQGKCLLAIEVKSGRKKDYAGLEAFRQLYPHTQSLLVTKDLFQHQFLETIRNLLK